jgi:hypothetical protein
VYRELQPLFIVGEDSLHAQSLSKLVPFLPVLLLPIGNVRLGVQGHAERLR